MCTYQLCVRSIDNNSNTNNNNSSTSDSNTNTNSNSTTNYVYYDTQRWPGASPPGSLRLPSSLASNNVYTYIYIYIYVYI